MITPKHRQKSNRPRHHSFDIIIIGEDIAALSCLYHLHQMGYKKIGWITPFAHPPALSVRGVPSGGSPLMSHPIDYLTRFTHRYGQNAGYDVWQSGVNGYLQFLNLCQKLDVSFAQGTRKSFSMTPFETVEQKKCADQFEGYQVCNFQESQWANNEFKPISALESDGVRSAWYDSTHFSTKLMNFLQAPRFPTPIEEIFFNPFDIKLKSVKNNLVFQAEMVVITCPKSLRTLFPHLDEILIPVVDQFDEFIFQNHFISSEHLPIDPGTFWGLSYGQTWTFFKPQKRVMVGGSRFLLPLAGIGSSHSDPSSRISTHHTKLISKIFPHQPFQHSSSKTEIDIYPCDETPMVGPLPSEPRLLIATGFFGFGQTLSFQAGQWLSQMIDQAQAPLMPQIFDPSRLRSLPEII